jgi:hypothetical protein
MEPVKLENMALSVPLLSGEGPEMVTRGEVNESLKFLSKYLAAVPNSNPKKQTQTL